MAIRQNVHQYFCKVARGTEQTANLPNGIKSRFPVPLICTGARRNPETCDINQRARKRRATEIGIIRLGVKTFQCHQTFSASPPRTTLITPAPKRPRLGGLLEGSFILQAKGEIRVLESFILCGSVWVDMDASL